MGLCQNISFKRDFTQKEVHQINASNIDWVVPMLLGVLGKIGWVTHVPMFLLKILYEPLT